ncbi:MAG: hypothetical protein CMB58_000465 [Methanobacteriota archaeon]|nr:MAG: hypothetical protein CMB58_000465 [Euryarchaeota archaeon]|tara:strand:+ start:28612 stop:28938 length:327 start_codon:yes stop_codon:yes gene_type:complete
MEVKGKLVKMLKLETGVSKSGKEWKKQTVVVDNGEEFNNLIAISAFGEDKIKDLNKLQEGMTVSILCNVYSREYKGKYYHNIDGYWFTQKAENEDFVTSDSNENDLPF